ncbi:ras GEF [Myriangium duriaei CBS 260.36]|uniref:Ras GEF n=1 Tax=Myriangium duriaei CBS 260.36 TaxID=1168546 RepID=A0A9P4J7X8_9PEZI|nr:ras GEF [Myriangium duriaei CBS 260.36]
MASGYPERPKDPAWTTQLPTAENFVLQSPPKQSLKARFADGDPTLAPIPSTLTLKSPQPSHSPFILAFSSEVLATQFTVIERDALEEIDWKELVELRWSKGPTPVLNWADYMRIPDQTGVDIVIARFNLVVKWAVSEILLTTDIYDRARTITKLIHIASHARHLRNYATAYQLTIALLSTAVSRLRKTWELVQPSEKETLASLEQLVQPMRNFATLRQEMEASLLAPAIIYVSLKPGACIPFIGIYTHDLAYIAQKPAFVDAAGNPVAAPIAGGVSAGAGAMVNFERFQAAAAAVKNMLRLLEASAKYTIRPNRELVARCLWLAALEDADLEGRSRALE